MNAVPIDDAFVAIVHPNVATDLMLSEGWLETQKYANPENIYKGEIGMLGGVRFVQSTEAKIFGTAVRNTVSAGTTSQAAFVLGADPGKAGAEYLSKAGNKLMIGGAEHEIAAYDPESKTVTLSAAATLAQGAAVLSADAGKDGVSVYCACSSPPTPTA